ncbi:MAG: hypothetical protein AABZ39_12100 [Spirochaetota bacterium]
MKKNDGIRMLDKGHEDHLCYLRHMGLIAHDTEEYKKLVRGSKYLCATCGRTAKDKKNLCRPVAL